MNGTILDMEDLIIRTEMAVKKAANIIRNVNEEYFSGEEVYFLRAYKEDAETKCEIVQDYIRETRELVREMYDCFRELCNEERSKTKKQETV